MRVLLTVALLVALTLAGCSSGDSPGGDTPQGDPLTGSIRGLVVDSAIAPVAGAVISLTGGPDAGKTTQSGVNGQFNFTGLVPGDYFVAVAKAGYKGSQGAATVVAGDAEPQLVKLLLERIATAQPYLDHFKLDGYYDCAFSYGEEGRPLITDSCDFAYRTAWDAVNGTGNEPPVPRTAQKAINTQFIDIPQDTFAVVQEGFWDNDNVPVMMILLSSTPISNDCDCSDKDYLDVTQPNPTFGRLDRYNASAEVKGFPIGERVAARGFLSWESTATAQNLQFVVITTLFHNYVPDPAWTFETRANFPVE